MRKVETRVRVRYAETDQMGIVYYSNYLVWMEVGRVDYCSHAGFQYHDMERKGGVTLTVTEVQCTYRAATRFGDEVQILTWVTDLRSRSLRFSYEMRRTRDNQLLATGTTQHLVCDLDGKPVRLPGRYRSFFDVKTG